ncbi:MAG: hypothetical protein EBU33_06200, partial [Sphingobacteriia bacterium]|nr:hypothetical protein [Sphingobacteriia bacterium]
MIITTLNSLDSLPQPALGLLPAIHDVDVENVPLVATKPVLPVASVATGRVFVNQTSEKIILPSYGKWPVRNLAPGELFGSDGRLFYKMKKRLGTTSFYPDSFERNIYNFTFTGKSFPIGESFEFKRNFFFRLFANTTIAVWNVIIEIGMRVDDVLPSYSTTINSTLVSGSSILTVPLADIGKIRERSLVSGVGIPSGLDGVPAVLALDAATGSVVLSHNVTVSGVNAITFTAPVGSNLGDYVWLPALLEEEVVLTEMKTMNPFGIVLKRWAAKDGVTSRNNEGYEAFSLSYNRSINCKIESLPTGDNFVLRVRLGYFDTQNSVSDPRGYVAYLIKD